MGVRTCCCAMEGASGATAKSAGVISFTFLSVLCTAPGSALHQVQNQPFSVMKKCVRCGSSV